MKQVVPKPRPWAVAVKYCGYFKNRSNPPQPLVSRLLGEQDALTILPFAKDSTENTATAKVDLPPQKKEIHVSNNFIFGKI